MTDADLLRLYKDFSRHGDAATRQPEGKRAETVEKYGWDVKYGYHTVRLLLEAEQILVEGDLDLTRGREHLKTIRSGHASREEVEQWFKDKEADLEQAYAKSTLRHSPDEEAIKCLLLECLEMHYCGTDGFPTRDVTVSALREIIDVAERALGAHSGRVSASVGNTD